MHQMGYMVVVGVPPLSMFHMLTFRTVVYSQQSKQKYLSQIRIVVTVHIAHMIANAIQINWMKYG